MPVSFQPQPPTVVSKESVPFAGEALDTWLRMTGDTMVATRKMNTGRGWILAVLLHLSAVLLGILPHWHRSNQKIDSAPFILELVSNELPDSHSPAVEAIEKFLEDIKLPEIIIPELPAENEEPEDPAPEQTAKEEVMPPPPATKKISYEEFLKKHPKLKEKPKAKKPAPAPKQLNASKSKAAADKTLPAAAPIAKSTNPSGGAMDPSILANFNANLLRKIDSAWLKPVGDITDGLVTIVEFTVAPKGQISQVSIIQSSGNPAADRSVLDAFARVGNAGKPPHDAGGTYRLTFRLNR